MKSLGLLIAAVVSAAALTSCADDTEGNEPDPSPPGSSSPASTPTTDEPSTPPDLLSPRETIREFVRVQNAFEASGDPAEFLEMCFRSDYCRKHAELISGIFENGGYVRTRGWQLLSIKPVGDWKDSLVAFDVTVDSGPTEYRTRKGSPVKTLPGGKVTYLINLMRRPDGWKVGHVAEYPR